jgi:hypothetical protein
MMLTLPKLLGVTLGQQGYLNMGRQFKRGGAGLDPGEVLLLVGGLAAIITVAVLISRYFAARQKQGFTSEGALFAELRRAHRLKWAHCRLLKQLAAHHEMKPCELFLDPSRFERAKLQGEIAHRGTELLALQKRLFSEPV